MRAVGQNRALLFVGTLATSIVANAARADIIISSDPTQNMTCSAGICSPTVKRAVLNITDLTNLLALQSQTVTTYFYVKSHRRSAGNIDLIAPLNWTGSSILTFTASRGISIGAQITVMGHGGLVLSPGYPGWKLENSVTFWDVSSIFKVGSSQFVLVGDLPTLVSDVAANPSGAYALASDYDAHGDVFAKAPVPNFQGQFTGLGHAISNLSVKRGSKLCEGLFSNVNRGTIRDLILHAVTIGLDTKSRIAGAIAGCISNSSSIFHVFADGSVTGISDGIAGGIAGLNDDSSRISDSHSAVSVLGGKAGGVLGEATGPVTGNLNVGGLVGENQSNVSFSFATGAVTGNNNTGGLIGSNHGSLENSYALGSTSGGGGAAGGVLGFNAGSVSQAYSTGTVTGEQGYTGGFVGYDPLESISLSYWDLDTSGISDPHQGSGSPTDDPGMEGLTSAQLQAKLPYGFEKRVWKLDAGVNGGFPYLQANPPQ